MYGPIGRDDEQVYRLWYGSATIGSDCLVTTTGATIILWTSSVTTILSAIIPTMRGTYGQAAPEGVQTASKTITRLFTKGYYRDEDGILHLLLMAGLSPKITDTRAKLTPWSQE